MVACSCAVVSLEDVDMLAGLLSEVVAHWDLFLGHLGVSPEVRDEIRHDNANKPRFCQRSLLDGLCRWVESEEQPSYGRLTAALREMAASELLLERVQHFAETHTCLPRESASCGLICMMGCLPTSLCNGHTVNTISIHFEL